MSHIKPLDERKEAARESLQEKISEKIGSLVCELNKGDENEVLNYEEKEIAALIVEVVQQDYHIGGGK